jgi:hypothetical protein
LAFNLNVGLDDPIFAIAYYPRQARRALAQGPRHGLHIIADMNALLASGCEQVFLENRVVREAIGEYGEKLEISRTGAPDKSAPGRGATGARPRSRPGAEADGAKASSWCLDGCTLAARITAHCAPRDRNKLP